MSISQLYCSTSLFSQGEYLKPADFKFLCLLGDGAYGEVWKSRYKKTEQYYAIKIVSKEKVALMLPQFQREIYIMYIVSHPHIIKLYEHFEDFTSYYLVMELAENGTLRDKLSQVVHLEEKTIKQYFLETLLAVEYLHSHVPPIIHRDIKPENIMFDKGGRVKLCDFGFSNYYDTERKTACGTLEYLPPEIVEKKYHGTSVDIWSLGILLYEMFTGVTPFSDGDNAQVLSNISSLNVKCPLEVPPLAKDLISLMLEKNHDKRLRAKEVKEHRWVQEFEPRPGTIMQELVPTLIKQGKITGSLKGEVAFTPSPREINNSIVFSFRKSINSMKNHILDKNLGINNTRSLVTKHKDMLSTNLKILKQLEKKLHEKKAKFSEIVSKEKLMTAKIKDLDYDILRIVNVCEAGVFKNKVFELRNEVEQQSKECKIQSEILKNLRQKVKLSTISIFEKEDELQELCKSLNEIKERSIKENKETELEIHELFEYSKLLTTQVMNSKNPFPLVGLDQKLSEEIVTFVSNYMDENPEDLAFALRRLINLTESKARSLEKSFSNMKILYSEEREKILTLIKKKKDQFFSLLRRKQHGDIQKISQENREKEYKIINFIENSRQKENEHCVEVLDITIAQNKILVKDI